MDESNKAPETPRSWFVNGGYFFTTKEEAAACATHLALDPPQPDKGEPRHEMRWAEGFLILGSSKGLLPPPGKDLSLDLIHIGYGITREVQSWEVVQSSLYSTRFKTKEEANAYLAAPNRLDSREYNLRPSHEEPNDQVTWREGDVKYSSGGGLLPPPGVPVLRLGCYETPAGVKTTREPDVSPHVATWKLWRTRGPLVEETAYVRTLAERDRWSNDRNHFILGTIRYSAVTSLESPPKVTHELVWTDSDGVTYGSSEGLLPPEEVTYQLEPISGGERFRSSVRSWELTGPLYFRTRAEAEIYRNPEEEGPPQPSLEEPDVELHWMDKDGYPCTSSRCLPPRDAIHLTAVPLPVSEERAKAMEAEKTEKTLSWKVYSRIGNFGGNFKTEAEADAFMAGPYRHFKDYVKSASSDEPDHEVVWHEDGVLCGSGGGLLPSPGVGNDMSSLDSRHPKSREPRSWGLYLEDTCLGQFGSPALAAFAGAPYPNFSIRPLVSEPTANLMWTEGEEFYISSGGLLPGPEAKGFHIRSSRTGLGSCLTERPVSYSTLGKKFKTRWEAERYAGGREVKPSQGEVNECLTWKIKGQIYSSLNGLRPPAGGDVYADSLSAGSKCISDPSTVYPPAAKIYGISREGNGKVQWRFRTQAEADLYVEKLRGLAHAFARVVEEIGYVDDHLVWSVDGVEYGSKEGLLPPPGVTYTWGDVYEHEPSRVVMAPKMYAIKGPSSSVDFNFRTRGEAEIFCTCHVLKDSDIRELPLDTGVDVHHVAWVSGRIGQGVSKNSLDGDLPVGDRATLLQMGTFFPRVPALSTGASKVFIPTSECAVEMKIVDFVAAEAPKEVEVWTYLGASFGTEREAQFLESKGMRPVKGVGKATHCLLWDYHGLTCSSVTGKRYPRQYEQDMWRIVPISESPSDAITSSQWVHRSWELKYEGFSYFFKWKKDAEAWVSYSKSGDPVVLLPSPKYPNVELTWQENGLRYGTSKGRKPTSRVDFSIGGIRDPDVIRDGVSWSAGGTNYYATKEEAEQYRELTNPDIEIVSSGRKARDFFSWTEKGIPYHSGKGLLPLGRALDYGVHHDRIRKDGVTFGARYTEEDTDPEVIIDGEWVLFRTKHQEEVYHLTSESMAMLRLMVAYTEGTFETRTLGIYRMTFVTDREGSHVVVYGKIGDRKLYLPMSPLLASKLQGSPAEEPAEEPAGSMGTFLGLLGGLGLMAGMLGGDRKTKVRAPQEVRLLGEGLEEDLTSDPSRGTLKS